MRPRAACLPRREPREGNNELRQIRGNDRDRRPGGVSDHAGAAVYFINLKDGDTVTSPFKVQFGLTGMGVAPVGVEKENTGHHHLIIDATLSPDELKAPIAADAKHVHYGAGQTEGW